ncbi:HNH endonuclease [Micromonospora sp. WMMD712]|uniref:HNH endonuclease n=1 Tax=Micromonospora sp. WMMD712 TaxID=3016096 RepID=UPI00249C9D72|nr:HNH endonuclease [Micromonospora sp. WMMD712]WFE60076.1 HNH endonuclease [Micromonospora sp. WMMD712]
MDRAGEAPLDFGDEPPGPTETAPLRLIKVLRPRSFDRCPICGDAATTEEHVPPQRLGGTKMTRTCDRCNHGFGSLVEADLIDWYDGALTMPSFEADTVRGKRQTGRLLVRWSPNRQFVLLPEGRVDPAICEILAAGDVTLEVSPPNENRWRLALLKSMYLAVCLNAGIPEGEPADRIRAELMAVRNAKRKADVPVSAIAHGLTVLRHWGDPITEESVMLAEIQLETGPLPGVLLAGRVFVSLSSTGGEAMPAPTGRLTHEVRVGTSVKGTVASVRPEPPPQRTHRNQAG